MKTLQRLLIGSLIVLVLFSCKNKQSDKGESVAEPVKEADTELVTHLETLFENEFATVSKVSLQPGEEQQLHQGGNRLIYSLNNYTIAWEENGKDLGEKSWKKGEVHSHEPGMHKAKNVGKELAEWLVFTRIGGELPPCDDYDDGEDVNSVKPESVSVLIDNDLFKAMGVILNSGDSIPYHNGINRVIYSLTDYTIEYTSDKMGTVNKDFQEGDVHWHEACKHAIKNTGSSDAQFLVVLYKN